MNKKVSFKDLGLIDYKKCWDYQEELFAEIEDKVVWLEVPYGHVVIFWHGLLHGNRINEEEKSRWTINLRFKGLLTPYHAKELGEYFMPLTIRPITRMGYQYKKPKI